jgi:hypothetical protein
MRRVVGVELMSVDGVMESPVRWASSYSNDEMEKENASGISQLGSPSSRVGCAVEHGEQALGREHRRKQRP